MPHISVAENPALAAEALRSIEQENKRKPEPPPMRDLADTVFDLCGGYYQDNGVWATQFEVRELTGRDEEALGRVTDPARAVLTMIERGLVRVGDDAVSAQVVDSVLGGDWETILIALRTITFGPLAESTWKCFSCNEEFTATTDLTEIPKRTLSQDDLRFEVTGRKGVVYEIEHPYGATQRKIMAKINAPAAELNSMLLLDCLRTINGRPSLGMSDVLSLPMADRKAIISELNTRRVGPLLGEVKSECPSCGVEQATPINVAALFR